MKPITKKTLHAILLWSQCKLDWQTIMILSVSPIGQILQRAQDVCKWQQHHNSPACLCVNLSQRRFHLVSACLVYTYIYIYIMLTASIRQNAHGYDNVIWYNVPTKHSAGSNPLLHGVFEKKEWSAFCRPACLSFLDLSLGLAATKQQSPHVSHSPSSTISPSVSSS